MRLIDADELLERLRNAEAFYTHETAGDFDMGRPPHGGRGLKSYGYLVADDTSVSSPHVKPGASSCIQRI